MPVATDGSWPGRDDFLQALSLLRRRAGRRDYKGSSTCRLCGRGNGGAEFSCDGWTWPSGYAHYVRDHGVRPSAAFLAFVTGTSPAEP